MTVFEILYLALACGLFAELFRGELKRRKHRQLREAQRRGADEHRLIAGRPKSVTCACTYICFQETNNASAQIASRRCRQKT